jgi:hypothetical protein
MGYRDARQLDLLISTRREPQEGWTVWAGVVVLERGELVRRLLPQRAAPLLPDI